MYIPLTGVICLLSCLFVTAPIRAFSRQQAIQTALEQNLEIEAARNAWQAERAKRLQTWSPPDPELEIEHEGMAGVFQFSSFEERNIGIVQPIPFPLTWWLNTKSATHQVQAVRWGVYETTRQNVALKVHLAYDRALADAQIVGFASQHVQLAKHLLNSVQKRFEAGDVPKLDVMRARVSLGRQENRLARAKNDLALAKVTLNTLLNQPADTPLSLADSLVFEPRQPLKTVQRPEFKSAQNAYESARAKRAQTTASLIPDVSVGIFRQTTAAPAGRQKAWRTSIALKLPLWFAVRQRGQISAANARLAESKAQRDQIKLKIAQEISAARTTLEAATQRAGWMQQEILPTAKAAYDMARRSYEEGKASYLDLIEAQRDLIDAQTEYAETLFEQRAAHAQLMRATGNILRAQEDGQ